MSSADITPKELYDLINRGVQFHLIDVREPFEAEICSLPNSVLIPLGEFTSRISEISRDTQTIIYCRSGARSGDAARYLQGLGYQNVHNLAGGILRWADEIDPTLQKY